MQECDRTLEACWTAAMHELPKLTYELFSAFPVGSSATAAAGVSTIPSATAIGSLRASYPPLELARPAIPPLRAVARRHELRQPSRDLAAIGIAGKCLDKSPSGFMT